MVPCHRSSSSTIRHRCECHPSNRLFPPSNDSSRSIQNVPITRLKCMPCGVPSLSCSIAAPNSIDFERSTFSPCCPSTLLNFDFACHDSIPCQDPSVKRKTTHPSTDLSRKAFFSALYIDNNFLERALLLGHTLRKYHPHHQMYMVYLEKALSNRILCSLRQVGWIPRAVQNIAPPLRGAWSHFINQFTELTL